MSKNKNSPVALTIYRYLSQNIKLHKTLRPLKNPVNQMRDMRGIAQRKKLMKIIRFSGQHKRKKSIKTRIKTRSLMAESKGSNKILPNLTMKILLKIMALSIKDLLHKKIERFNVRNSTMKIVQLVRDINFRQRLIKILKVIVKKNQQIVIDSKNIAATIKQHRVKIFHRIRQNASCIVTSIARYHKRCNTLSLTMAKVS